MGSMSAGLRARGAEVLIAIALAARPVAAAPPLWADPTRAVGPPPVARPGYLAPILDPTFGTQVVRVANDVGASTAPVSGTWGSDARHVYSKQQPWNSDETMISIENRSGGSPSPLILDGTTYQPKSG